MNLALAVALTRKLPTIPPAEEEPPLVSTTENRAGVLLGFLFGKPSLRFRRLTTLAEFLDEQWTNLAGNTANSDSDINFLLGYNDRLLSI